MRAGRLLVWLAIALFLVSTFLACGGGGDAATDPATPVRNFFDAFAALDADKAADAVCEQYREEVVQGLEMIFELVSLGDKEPEIEITDLELDIQDETEDEARIIVKGGKIKLEVMGQTQEEDLATDDEAVRVVKENGRWFICDDTMVEGFVP